MVPLSYLKKQKDDTYTSYISHGLILQLSLSLVIMIIHNVIQSKRKPWKSTEDDVDDDHHDEHNNNTTSIIISARGRMYRNREGKRFENLNLYT